MTITPKQKKIIWISIAALAVIYYAPAYITQVAQSTRPEQKPSPFQAPARPVIPPAVATVDAPFLRFIGQYAGRGAITGRGVCFLKFELRGSTVKPGSFAGYETLICQPSVQPGLWRQNMIASPKTTSALLTGTADPASIRFTVDDVIGAAGGCAPTALTLKPFGLNQIAVEWQDACKGGQMLLGRTGR